MAHGRMRCAQLQAMQIISLGDNNVCIDLYILMYPLSTSFIPRCVHAITGRALLSREIDAGSRVERLIDRDIDTKS